MLMAQAKHQGISQRELCARAGVLESTLSRALASGNCQSALLDKLLGALQLRVVLVPDNDLAGDISKGSVF